MLLLDDGVVVQQADGTGTVTYRQVAQILNRDAIDRWAEETFGYDGGRQRFRLNWARVVRPDGTVVSAEPIHQQVADVPVPEQSPVYTDLKRVRVSLGGVERGHDRRLQLHRRDGGAGDAPGVLRELEHHHRRYGAALALCRGRPRGIRPARGRPPPEGPAEGHARERSGGPRVVCRRPGAHRARAVRRPGLGGLPPALRQLGPQHMGRHRQVVCGPGQGPLCRRRLGDGGGTRSHHRRPHLTGEDRGAVPVDRPGLPLHLHLPRGRRLPAPHACRGGAAPARATARTKRRSSSRWRGRWASRPTRCC